MSKSLLLALCLFFSFNLSAQNKGNYVIIINNDSIFIDLDNEKNYKTSSGDDLSIKITQPDELTYSNDMISFKYDKSLSVSNTKIEDGIEQCMIMKSTGNGFMVQTYRTMDPSSLTELMLHEITKESVSYGYSKKEKKFKKKLISGETIEGIEATLTYNGQKEIYTVASYGQKDAGIIVVTILLNDDFKEDEKILDLFLETLELIAK